MSTSITLPQAVCVNCNLSTRSDLPKCLHGEHPWKVKVEPKRKTNTSFGIVGRTYQKGVIQ